MTRVAVLLLVLGCAGRPPECEVAPAGVVSPALSGPWCVGVETRILVDPRRADPFDPTPGTPRELALTLHYPVAPGSGGVPAPYGDLELWGVRYGAALSPDLFSRAVRGAAIAEVDEGFPLLLYSPGFAGGLAETNTFMVEALVSHGYVVASVDHPYVSLAVRRSDGEVVRFGDGHPALAMPDEGSDGVYAFPVVVDDLRFVLDSVLSDPAWRGRIDAGRIGAFGHSYGGAAAAELLRSDRRVRAALNYDGRYHAGVLEHGVGGPLLLMAIDGRITGDPPPNDNPGYREATRTASPGWFVEIEGAVHGMFQADLGVLLKWKRGRNDPHFSGEVDADLNLALCNAFNLAFFDACLKDGPVDALERAGEGFPGVRFGVASEE